MKKVTPDNEAPSNVTDHPFTPPEGKPYGTCAHPGCGLAESVHRATTQRFETTAKAWRCTNCVTKDIDPCFHTRENWEHEAAKETQVS